MMIIHNYAIQLVNLNGLKKRKDDDGKVNEGIYKSTVVRTYVRRESL